MPGIGRWKGSGEGWGRKVPEGTEEEVADSAAPQVCAVGGRCPAWSPLSVIPGPQCSRRLLRRL